MLPGTVLYCAEVIVKSACVAAPEVTATVAGMAGEVVMEAVPITEGSRANVTL